MTLDECITYLQNVSSERKPRSRKARQIIKYLEKLKGHRESAKRVCATLQAEMFDYNNGFLLSNYESGYNDGIKRAIDILSKEQGEENENK